MKIGATKTMAAVTLSVLATAPIAAANAQTEKVIYSFQSGNDAQGPQAGLALLSGTFYGTTSGGGTYNEGTVYSVTPGGSEQVIYSFTGGADGARPEAGLLPVGSSLFGTTTSYGTGYGGTAFSVTTSGTLHVLQEFASTSPSSPYAALIKAGALLYGTTKYASTAGSGAVYSLSKNGVYKTLHIFKGGKDGAYPVAPLLYFNGLLYGTTSGGGKYNCGTVFSITLAGKETVLYSFKGGKDGSTPQSGLVALNGTLYGTTSVGGGQGISPHFGTVYSITPGGDEKVVYAFGTNTVDGANPQAELIVVNGRLYGTTYQGGAYIGGTVFSVTTAGIEHVLYNFPSYDGDGSYPQGKLVSYDGSFYGVTGNGGANNNGSVFKVTP